MFVTHCPHAVAVAAPHWCPSAEEGVPGRSWWQSPLPFRRRKKKCGTQVLTRSGCGSLLYMHLDVLVIDSAGESTGGSPKGPPLASCCDFLQIDGDLYPSKMLFIPGICRPGSVPLLRCRPAWSSCCCRPEKTDHKTPCNKRQFQSQCYCRVNADYVRGVSALFLRAGWSLLAAVHITVSSGVVE